MTKIPKLRFKEFEGEWEEKKLGDILYKISNPVKVVGTESYRQIGIRSHGKGIFYKENVLGKELGNKRVFWVESDVFILNIVFAWEQAIARTTKKDIGLIASHRFPMYKPKNVNLDYILKLFNTKKGKIKLELASPGGAGRNKTLGQKEFEKIYILIPNLKEQEKIALFLSVLDEKIGLEEDKLQNLKLYKKGLMQKIFNRELRFKDENGQDYPEWEEKNFNDVYCTVPIRDKQIKNSSIEKYGKFQVVDQGKENVCGYTDDIDKVFFKTPIIVYGDHTTIIKFRDKEFVVGGDGVKLFTNKIKFDNLKFLYYALYFNNINPEGYKRHFNILNKKKVFISQSEQEQQKIANFLSSIDNKIEKQEQKLQNLKLYKRGLLSQMFV